MFKRVHLIVLDSVGIGEAPDAEKFGDVGSDTLGHIAKEAGLTIPHLEKLGLGTIAPLTGVKAVADHDVTNHIAGQQSLMITANIK